MIEYKTYPYTFSGLNGATISGVIRMYNHQNMNSTALNILIEEFTKINPEATPPKLGQTVQIPVLLPFCNKHENNEQKLSELTTTIPHLGGPLNF